LVYVEGRLRLRTWEGQDGKTRARNEVIADKVKFLDRQGAPAAGNNKPDDLEQPGDVEPDDIPF
jgi:single-strand DNA-binding protein